MVNTRKKLVIGYKLQYKIIDYKYSYWSIVKKTRNR